METIGSALKAARQRRRMTPGDVAEATKMSTAYVEAIDTDRFAALVAPVYARGFIKLYAECVGLDPKPLLQQFSQLGRRHPAAAAPMSLPAARPAAPAAAPEAVAALPGAGRAAAGRVRSLAQSAGRRLASVRFPPLTAWRPRLRVPAVVARLKDVPGMVWRQAALAAGLAAVILAAAAASVWLARRLPALPDEARWAAEPPAPIMPADAGPAPAAR